MKTLIYFILCINAFSLFAKSNTVTDQLENEWQNTKTTYLKLDSEFKEKNPYQHPEYIEAIEGKKSEELVYIIHGFMGTPYEMKLFKEKALFEGKDVYNDLIFGYGGSTKLVNQTTSKEWMKNFYQRLNILSSSYKKIHFVGFSTGGLMISHMIKERTDLKDKIGSVTLVSPFFKPDLFFAEPLNNIVRLFTSSVPASWLYNLVGYPDVLIMLKLPDYYMQSVPLDAANQVIDLAHEFTKNNNETVSEKSDIVIHLSKNDRVLDYEFSTIYLKKVFPKATILSYEGEMAPHHLMVPEVSKETKKLTDLFLANHAN